MLRRTNNKMGSLLITKSRERLCRIFQIPDPWLRIAKETKKLAMSSSSSQTAFRSRSKTLPMPSRVKIEKKIVQEPKTRSPLPFRRLADLLKRKKKRSKGTSDSFNVPLERQTWFHGKITADFAERYLRRDGNFLVREDPAKPGSCFIVVRHKRSAVHIPLVKVNSSKGTRIKYRTEESESSFDSICELINYYVTEKKPLTPNTSAIITHAVSRDATLLSSDDLKSFNSNHHKRYVTNTVPANACPPNPPGTGPLRQRRIEKPARKNSDPGLHLEDPDKKESLENYYDKPGENEKSSTSVDASGKAEHYDEKNEKEKDDGYYDKPANGNEDQDFYDKPSPIESAKEYYDKPPKQCSQASLPNIPREQSQEDIYDKPRRSIDCLYDTPRASQDNLYDKPPPKPKRTESFRNSDPTVSSKIPPKLVSRCSAPALRTYDSGASAPRGPSFETLPEKRHSGAEFFLRKATSKNSSSGGVNLEPKSYYSTPPSRQTESPMSSKSDLGLPENLDIYDVPTESGATEQVLTPSKATDCEKENHTSPNVEDSRPKRSGSVDKKGIFLNVMKKIGENLLSPFLEIDCFALARHMTRVDLIQLWGEEPQRQSWSIEDGTGGAKGLEILTLPQGRDQRAQLLSRFSNVRHWVATLVVAAGDLGTRGKVLKKLIELADVLSDKLGNLVSFMAVMEGLSLPQVTRLHHAWSCLHHQCSSTAILYHSTLKPLAGLLSSGAPSPFPGVSLPYIIPLVRYLEMTPEEILSDWAHAEVDLGLETVSAHLDSGRILTQQLEEFRVEAITHLRKDDFLFDPKLINYFQEKVNVGNVLGLGPDPTNRTNKLRTLLQWLSENAEHPTSAETSGV
ncbi:SH2 domain-containing protein 3C [Stylophora pistillata]|uniref:SH2 domain-containing protein 3C n=1 Tax=Stylophora pistillata TaxID=50429 RepID=A0A2B4T267_STYPI|nr:SH2 domain-containing protein 3C [Stylophora pistillata]